MKLINENYVREIYDSFSDEDKEYFFDREAFNDVSFDELELTYEIFYQYLVNTLISNVEYDLHITLPEEV